jgi:hypothetical protein
MGSPRVQHEEAVRVALTAGVKPIVAFTKSADRWKSKCLTCARIVYPTHHHMKKGQKGCGYCAKRRIDPEVARKFMISNGVTPLIEYPGNSKRWKSRCSKCERIVFPTYEHVRGGIKACTFCSGRKIDGKEAIKIMTQSGARPLEPFIAGHLPWKSKCLTCLREINPKYNNVKRGHHPCIYCSRRHIDDESAKEFARSRGLNPISPYPGKATARWRVRCIKCKRVSTVSWTTLNMKRKNAGCSSCTEYGFKPLEPAYFYVITHEFKRAHKVGIGNTSSRRIEKHVSNGWRVYKVVEFEKGSSSHALEQKILTWLREIENFGPAYRRGDGWTETVSSRDITLNSLWRQCVAFGADKGKMIAPKSFARAGG